MLDIEIQEIVEDIGQLPDNRSDTEKYRIPEPGNYNFKNIDITDPRIWAAYHLGSCKGVFQVESSLCKDLCRRMRPSNIDELAALLSLCRPGGLESGATEKYIRIKNGEEEPSYIHEALRPILEKTHSCLCFQEQILQICIFLAGFTETDADLARRAVGKKLPEEMHKVKTMFIDGCAKKGTVSKEIAEEIFSWIEKSVRYLFNACITKDTVVETNNGYKTIDDLHIGDQILAPSDDNTTDESVTVKNIYDNGYKDVFEIQLESGKSIKSTLDHEFICEDNIKRQLYQIILENHKILCQD